MPEDSRPDTYICVIPVIMQESWMLFDESAIRRASGNPNGTQVITLPKLLNTENIPNPKTILHETPKIASGRYGRKLNNFNVGHSAKLVSEYTEDFSPLRELNAFQELEADLIQAINSNEWNI